MSEQAKMAKIAYNALDEKKGEDIKIIDISGISVMADYFIIANGNSITQVQALVDNVEEKMNQSGFIMKRKEGNRSSTWVLLDFGDVVVHVFDNEDRLFYDLERIWSDGKTVEISALEQPGVYQQYALPIYKPNSLALFCCLCFCNIEGTGLMGLK